MLLQFVVENFRSFSGEESLNLMPVKSRIHADHILESSKEGKRVRGLPVAALYGANASGKSNLVKAIAYARRLVIKGTRGESSTKAEPFLLAPNAEQNPGRFEFVLKHDSVVYKYGFTVTKEKVLEEWLFAVYKNQEELLYERVTRGTQAVVQAGDRLANSEEERNNLSFVAKGTRPNQLFLTEANERNIEKLKPLMRWFRECLIIISPDAKYKSLVLRASKDKKFTTFLAAYLRAADTGIVDIDIKTEAFDKENHLQEVPASVREDLLNKMDKHPAVFIALDNNNSLFALEKEEGKAPEFSKIQFKHQGAGGSSALFDAANESDGTRRIMHLAPALLDLHSSEHVYIVDELDRSLHPLLCRQYVETFLRCVRGGKCMGQLIITTHDTNLLDLKLLRRDEIWFVEKDNNGASHLTSLAEYKYTVRADLKVAKGYLNGRFGAIPYVGDTNKLLK